MSEEMVRLLALRERKHRIVIAKARLAYNTECFEQTVISRIWHEAYMRWTGDDLDKHFHSGMSGIQQNCPLLADSFGADEAAVGHELHSDGMTFAVGDIFTAHGQLYETDGCAVVDGQPLILARPMDVSGTLSQTATLCKKSTGDLVAIKLNDKIAMHAHCWYWEWPTDVLFLHAAHA